MKIVLAILKSELSAAATALKFAKEDLDRAQKSEIFAQDTVNEFKSAIELLQSLAKKCPPNKVKPVAVDLVVKKGDAQEVEEKAAGK